MTRTFLALIVALGLCAPAFAQPKDTDKKPAPPSTTPTTGAQPKPGDKAAAPQLPPGMTEEDAKDMQACVEAGTPGPMHEWLTKQAGTYQGKTKMWMKPGTPATDGTCTTTITPIFGGRYIKVESTGTMPGDMGSYEGQGIYGYDNVSKEFTSCWWDNMGSGIMKGTGSLSTDQKTLTINSKYNCPIQKKELSCREVWRHQPDGSMILEMFCPDKTGKEFKMMEITYAAKDAKKSATSGTTDMKAKPDSTVPAKK
jgi:hypothetical protein